ncbi:MAG: secondary thiamine-phosphate synthase enzyme YjbQ [Gemmatimonadota bacterium]|nr:secondary thiamine-phosphate synthase enzyme YjbQ [Gemmatimonadota bacterium]
MTTWSDHIAISTRGNDDILDITDELRRIVAESGVSTGMVSAMVIGSTGALSTLEFEPGLVDSDIAAALEKIAPRDGEYVHERTWNDDNGHSHVRACLIGPSLALPIVEGTVPLGTWQQVVVLDFDPRPRDRWIAVTVVGV